MSEMLQRVGEGGKYQRHDPGLAQYVAEGGSRTLDGAHAKEIRVKGEAVKIVRSYVAAGKIARAQVFIARLQQEIPHDIPTETDDLVLEAQAADQHEDSLEHEYHLTRDPAVRRRWLRARKAAAVIEERLTRALEAVVA